MTILVTGGAGFIGSNFILEWFKAATSHNEIIINLDKLTYSGNLINLESVEALDAYEFIEGDINDKALVKQLLDKYQPRAVINFAAESHVDRSILSIEPFIQTNVVGTSCLLEVVNTYWQNLDYNQKSTFRFLHISTDEVYGSLLLGESAFTENSCYRPTNPYSASKAASDHLVRAIFHTHGLPVMITNCSNNYGPYIFPEKFIPLVILNALSNKKLPIYGDGLQIRDWLYVADHCSAIRSVLEKGETGETYNVGGNNEKANIDVVKDICAILDEKRPRNDGKNYANQIELVKDRPGHDRRYAINATKIKNELNWYPAETFESGLKKTIDWYLDNQEWVKHVQSRDYKDWIKKQYN